MKGKKIILGVPYEIKEEIKKNLEFLGFEVVDVSYPHIYKYKNWIEKLTNFVYKIVQGHLGYKKKLRFAKYSENLEKKILTLPKKADYALFIRPDLFPEDFVKFAVSKAEKSVAYQWDGIHIFPDIQRYTDFFDRFFVFDPNDISPNQNVLPTTNFFFDYNWNEENIKNEKNVYFVGSYFKGRIQPIQKISEIIAKTDFKNNIYIRTDKETIKSKYRDLGIVFLEENMSFSENLKNMKEATVLLDFLNGKHNGLSFRTFEAIGYAKKLITNNVDVKNYDFYHPNNFFVWEDENFEGLEDFLHTPYMEMPENMRQKYSFTNWIHYLLDIEPHQKIELPKAKK